MVQGILSIRDVLDRKIPRILPEHLMPTSYGVQWGTSFEHTREILCESILLQKSPYYAVVKTVIFIYRQIALHEIHVYPYISQSFWERDEDTVKLQSELLITLEQFYDFLAARYEEILGPPAFSGSWESPGYPEGVLATPLTIWDLHSGAFHVEFDHSDKELPIFVRLKTRSKVSQKVRL
jgi:hypothetical protein